MSSERELLVDAVSDIFAKHCTADAIVRRRGRLGRRSAGDARGAWLTTLLTPHDRGGPGAQLADAAAIVRLGGAFAAPVPLAETAFVGTWALAAAGLGAPAAPVTVASQADDELELERAGGRWRCRGRLSRVPWGSVASRVVTVAGVGRERFVASLPGELLSLRSGRNLAGEPRPDVIVEGRLAADDVAPAPGWLTGLRLRARGALARAQALAGALDRVLELTTHHASEREQFGRPIGRLQAVQQQLALLAGEVAAADAAADAAVGADDSDDWLVATAAAKVRVGRAAGAAASVAHQLHGAIGFTREHRLHHFTRRLWAWQEEFGAEQEWARRLGARVAEAGPAGVWPLVTGAPGRS